MKLEGPLSFETWRLGLAPRALGHWFSTRRFLLLSLQFLILILTIRIWRSQLLWYWSLCGLFLSFIHLTFFPGTGSFSACNTFGINFSNRACGFVSAQPVTPIEAVSFESRPGVLNSYKPWELLFSSHVTLKYVTRALCFDPKEHIPLSKSVFVPN